MKIIFQALLLIMAASFLALLISVLSSERTGAGFITPISQKQSSKDGKKEKVEIILTGDVMLGRSVMAKSLEIGDTTYPFSKVADVLNKADIVFVNLENPIISDCPITYEGFKFCARPEMVEGLVFGGVDIVNLANNHSGNYGDSGLKESVRILNQNKIKTTGLGSLVIEEVEGVKFGFLGFDFTVSSPTEGDYDQIDFAASQVDILIVGVHWGIEYTQNPTDIQREWAKNIIFSGADVVVGHGPHWVQDIEYIEERPIYYSLGNFIFDQMWSEETKKGLAIRLIFNGEELVKEERLPIYMSSWARPEFVE